VIVVIALGGVRVVVLPLMRKLLSVMAIQSCCMRAECSVFVSVNEYLFQWCLLCVVLLRCVLQIAIVRCTYPRLYVTSISVSVSHGCALVAVCHGAGENGGCTREGSQLIPLPAGIDSSRGLTNEHIQYVRERIALHQSGEEERDSTPREDVTTCGHAAVLSRQREDIHVRVDAQELASLFVVVVDGELHFKLDGMTARVVPKEEWVEFVRENVFKVAAGPGFRNDRTGTVTKRVKEFLKVSVHCLSWC